MSGKVIVLELNELSPVLMSRFIDSGFLPNFKKLRDESVVAISDAHEEPPALEPWIQWISVHTGLTYRQHKVFRLGDGESYTAQRTWDYVADSNLNAWVCGSMNGSATADRRENVHILPDPWSHGVSPRPAASFKDYFDFVRTYVQEHTRPRAPLTLREYARFARFMLANGLSANTVKATLLQLAGELMRTRQRWRRAAIMDRLQWDVFVSFYRKLHPEFSTFFLNSTAHYQHYYWRNMEPERFALKDTADRQAQYCDAIPFGYRSMDRIVGECLALARPDTSIVLATALSQQPMTTYELDGGKHVFRPRDIRQLTRFAGIGTPYEFLPVMAEEFHLAFGTHADAVEAQGKLASLHTADGRAVMSLQLSENRLFGGCNITRQPQADALVFSRLKARSRRFHDLFYGVTGVKSGMHHPDGILWIRLPSKIRKSEVLRRRIPIEEIGATLLELCGISTRAVKYPAPPMPEIMELLQPSTRLRAVG